MKFLASVSALAAFAATVLAQTKDFDPIYKPEANQKLTAGQTFEITWGAPAKYAAGTVSIHLIGGATQNTQVPLADLAAGIPNSQKSYSWTLDSSLGAEKVYGLVIKLESNPAIFQYSNPFHIVKADNSYGGGSSSDDSYVTTVSKDYGIKTVTLSSCPPTSTYTPPPVTTPVYTPPVYHPVNSTSTYYQPPAVPTKPAETTLVPVPPTQEPQPPKPSEVVVPGAGARFGASSVALVGAFVVAALAL
jgi:hypothetical protein